MKPQVEDVLDRWRAWQEMQSLSERSITERANCVRRYVAFSHEEPFRFTTDQLMMFLGRPKLAPRTRWTYHQHLSAYSTWLVKTKQRKDNPLADAPVPRKPAGVPRPVPSHQLEAVMRAAGRRRTRTMILLAALAGLRVHEIAKVHGRDVDLAAGTLRVIGKGGKDALIPMHPLLLQEARAYPSNSWWFPTYSADAASPHITRQAVSSTIGAALQRAGVDGTAHQLRHWYGTSLLEHGVDTRIVQELMRHSSLQSTQIYTKVSGTQRQLAIARLEFPTAS